MQITTLHDTCVLRLQYTKNSVVMTIQTGKFLDFPPPIQQSSLILTHPEQSIILLTHPRNSSADAPARMLTHYVKSHSSREKIVHFLLKLGIKNQLLAELGEGLQSP